MRGELAHVVGLDAVEGLDDVFRAGVGVALVNDVEEVEERVDDGLESRLNSC